MESVSLRISVTDLCPLRCFYCMPPAGVAQCGHGEVLRYEEIVRLVRVVKERWALGKVHLTGGEPLARRGLASLVRMLSELGVPDLAMTTCGLGLAEKTAALQAAGLARVNVSLDSLSEATYARITRGGRLADVLAGIEAARAAGLEPVKLNTVVLRGMNEGEVGRIARWALERGLVPRFLELMPIGEVRAAPEGLYVASDEVRARLEEDFELRALPCRPGASARELEARARDGSVAGRVGLISSRSRPFCAGCGRLRLTSRGTLIGCLARGDGPDLRPLLRGGADDEALAKVVGAVLAAKAPRSGWPTKLPMGGVGG